jgi:hypothetical protein
VAHRLAVGHVTAPVDPFRILVTGSRTWADQLTIERELCRVWLAQGCRRDVTLVHGDCKSGADRIADGCWRRRGLPVEPHPAQWKTYGLRAGLLRNQWMVDLGASVCLVFIQGDSRGATHCMTRAEEAGIPVHVWRNPT